MITRVALLGTQTGPPSTAAIGSVLRGNATFDAGHDC